jgi:hypothetical protein
MSEATRVVKMAVISPGSTEQDGEFSFELQPRYNPGRTVKFALIPSEAEQLHKELTAYLKAAQKGWHVSDTTSPTAMLEDVLREAAGEIVDSKDARRAISTATAKLFKKSFEDALKERA